MIIVIWENSRAPALATTHLQLEEEPEIAVELEQSEKKEQFTELENVEYNLFIESINVVRLEKIRRNVNSWLRLAKWKAHKSKEF